jgi:hypothetical protein
MFIMIYYLLNQIDYKIFISIYYLYLITQTLGFYYSFHSLIYNFLHQNKLIILLTLHFSFQQHNVMDYLIACIIHMY